MPIKSPKEDDTSKNRKGGSRDNKKAWRITQNKITMS